MVAVTVQVDPFSAVIRPTTPGAWPTLAGAAAVGGAVVVGVVVELLDAPEHAVTPMATEAPITPIASVVPFRGRCQLVTLFIGQSFLAQLQFWERVEVAFPVMARLGASKLHPTSQFAASSPPKQRSNLCRITEIAFAGRSPSEPFLRGLMDA